VGITTVAKHKRKSNTPVIETVLLLIIVVIIALTSYFVYRSNQKSNEILSTAAKVAQSSAPKPLAVRPGAPLMHDLFIKEWGVQAVYGGKLTLEYGIQKNGAGRYASFSSPQLDTSDPECKVNLTQEGGYGGVVARYKATDPFLVVDDSVPSGQTAAEYAATLPAANYGHVGDYYFFLTGPQGACGKSQASQNLEGQTTDTLEALLPHLQATQ
jgi:hypothetical protein